MRPYNRKFSWVFMLITFCLVLVVFSGCALVGPSSISMGRADYNEAINRTEDEQMLLSLVKGRYGETFSLLSVTGVAANVRFGSRAAIQAGFGPKANYVGELTPFSAGLAYEENPTITYAPVQGERYLRQLLSPIPLDILVLIIRAGTGQATYLTMLANRINDLKNPDFIEKPMAAHDHRFRRFVKLNQTLDQACVLQWVEDPRKDVPFDILITDYTPDYIEPVREYLNLLGLSIPADESADIIIPVYFSVKGRHWDGVAITTRSTYDLIEILRGAIEVPKAHVAAGLVHDGPAPGLAGIDICIHASKQKPDGAAVSVKYRGHWYFIDETDMPTKRFYDMVRTLWSVSIASAADQRAAPVLTLPVSR
jgi:hypothetical protein